MALKAFLDYNLDGLDTLNPSLHDLDHGLDGIDHDLDHGLDHDLDGLKHDPNDVDGLDHGLEILPRL